MNFPYWVIYTFILLGVALLIHSVISANWFSAFSNCCVIAVGFIAVWNKKNPDKSI